MALSHNQSGLTLSVPSQTRSKLSTVQMTTEGESGYLDYRPKTGEHRLRVQEILCLQEEKQQGKDHAEFILTLF